MNSVPKSKQLMKKIKIFGNNTNKKWINIGNKNIKLISFNGNIELNKAKLEQFKEKRKDYFLNKSKNKDKNNNNFKNTSKKYKSVILWFLS